MHLVGVHCTNLYRTIKSPIPCWLLSSLVSAFIQKLQLFVSLCSVGWLSFCLFVISICFCFQPYILHQRQLVQYIHYMLWCNSYDMEANHGYSTFSLYMYNFMLCSIYVCSHDIAASSQSTPTGERTEIYKKKQKATKLSKTDSFIVWNYPIRAILYLNGVNVVNTMCGRHFIFILLHCHMQTC